MKRIKAFIKSITEFISMWLKRFGAKKIITILLVSILTLWIVLSFFRTTGINQYYDGATLAHTYEKTTHKLTQVTKYSDVFLSYEEEGYTHHQVDLSFDTSTYEGTIASEEYQEMITSYQQYVGIPQDIFIVNDETQSVTISISDIEAGLYFLSLDYHDLEANIDDTQLRLYINDQSPFTESDTIALPATWQFETDEFALDRYQNEIQPRSEKILAWQTFVIKDRTGMHPNPFLYYLESGDEITLSFSNYNLLLGQLSFVSVPSLPTYDAYLSNYQNIPKFEGIQAISARHMQERSDASIRLRPEQDPSSLYYHTQFLRLNTVFGDSWQNGGQSITYRVNVEQAGLYQLSFKYRQYMIRDLPVFRTIKINNEIPFDLLESYAFPYTLDFLNRTLVDEENEPLWIYLQAGNNDITLEANSYPYRNMIEKVKEIMSNIQSLALDIKRYTAGGQDLYRDWDIDQYFPHAASDILSWADDLDIVYQTILPLASNRAPSETANLIVAASRLRSIARNINRLPSRMQQFSDGDASVNQLLGTVTQQFMLSNMELERLMIHGLTTLPKPYSNIFVSLYEGTARLILSFVNNPYAARANHDDELSVWVNYPRQYIEVLQALIDNAYDGPHRVTLSQMPDQNKLILANASGTAPDIALGMDHWLPYEFAIRNAAVDLRQFSGYEELVANFSKGTMISYVFEEGVYALPETQNFWVTFYREDILNSIGITHIPQTWDEVIAILPILQSYGMNYFLPMSQFVGLKPFVSTLPFIYQFGGNLYTEDGMQTAINSEQTLQGIRLMSELFTLYNIPKFVASFYNQFRYGMLPIGIGDLATYLLLQNVAVELSGQWHMDLHPGYLNPETDEIVRYAATGAQSAMILAATNKKDSAWDFLSWWLSTDIQSEFSLILQATYGRTYFWNSANLEAFGNSSMPKKYRDIVLSQWEYAVEASRIPGAYMVEREISNAWTKIVFENVNPRQALDEAMRISNREILYKMAEFGYVVGGEVVREYKVPTIYNIDDWLTEVGND